MELDSFQEMEEEVEEGEEGRAVLERIQDPGRKNIKKIHSLHIPAL